MSSCSMYKLFLTALERRHLIVTILATGAKVSLKSMPSFWLKPFAKSLSLNPLFTFHLQLNFDLKHPFRSKWVFSRIFGMLEIRMRFTDAIDRIDFCLVDCLESCGIGGGIEDGIGVGIVDGGAGVGGVEDDVGINGFGTRGNFFKTGVWMVKGYEQCPNLALPYMEYKGLVGPEAASGMLRFDAAAW
ncbi:hypothetical protein Tco_0226348 [Tanacetum coccineum]